MSYENNNQNKYNSNQKQGNVNNQAQAVKTEQKETTSSNETIQQPDKEIVSKGPRRVFTSEKTVLGDTYELLSTEYDRDFSRTKHPELRKTDHKHWFHTYNSDGIKKDLCSATHGHKHEVICEVINGELTAKCGRLIGPPQCKEHTHEIIYRKSFETKAREVSVEAMKFLARKQAPIIDGVKI